MMHHIMIVMLNVFICLITADVIFKALYRCGDRIGRRDFRQIPSSKSRLISFWGVIMNPIKLAGLNAVEKLDGKNYLHFDFPMTESERERLVSDISNGNIVHHRYLPFISFEIKFRVYHAKEKKVVPKSRKITLPSHHDAMVYRYYGHALNHLYSGYSINHHIDKVAVAYRERQPGVRLSNITTAKEVFDYVTSFDKSWIIKGDFHHFFDTLDHKCLADNLKKVFGEELPNDWIKMLRSITKYQAISRKTLESQLKDAHVERSYRLHQNTERSSRAYVKNLKELGTLVKSGRVRLSGKNNVGIPQGTAVSAALANVYMIDFDEWLVKRCEEFGGLYRRYSDDFILVMPRDQLSKASLQRLAKTIIIRSQVSLGLEIEPTKTKLYSYEKEKRAIMLLSGESTDKPRPSKIDYLGFIFDGVSVSMRPKSIYKFIYRGRRMLNKYITLGRAHNQFNDSVSESDIIKDKLIPKYAAHSGNDRKIYLSPNINQAFQMFGRLRQIRNITPEALRAVHKGVTIRYLSTEVRKPRSSMLGYAFRAQRIFEVGNPNYRVVIRRQVLRQIKRNQRRLHHARENYMRWKYYRLRGRNSSVG